MAIDTTEAVEAAQKTKFLRIKVVDATTPERPTVNVKMPIGLVNRAITHVLQASRRALT